MARVHLNRISKTYDGSVSAVKDVNLEISDHEFIVLVGPSGCGKSTTLRMIAGLEDISDGEITIDGRVINDVAARDRDIAMVFQNYALYPHMTVFENIAFGLRLRKLGREEIRRRVDSAARILDIAPLMDRKPKALSGGQRQRVAMGRAIVRDPKVFLFDEPLSNLDAKLRAQMRIEIKKVHQAVRTTTVHVTHDQIEAMTLADRVVVMNNGAIEQVGTPLELYHRPRTRFVASFIGSPGMNILPGRLEQASGALRLQFSNGSHLPLPAERTGRYLPFVDKEVLFGIRPEHLTAAKTSASGAPASINAIPQVVEPMGMETLVYFDLAGNQLCGRLDPSVPVTEGNPILMRADMSNAHLMDPATGLVL